MQLVTKMLSDNKYKIYNDEIQIVHFFFFFTMNKLTKLHGFNSIKLSWGDVGRESVTDK